MIKIAACRQAEFVAQRLIEKWHRPAHHDASGDCCAGERVEISKRMRQTFTTFAISATLRAQRQVNLFFRPTRISSWNHTSSGDGAVAQVLIRRDAAYRWLSDANR